MNFNNETPIYLQIVQIITREITNGNLKPNDKIPSVREYAALFKANPNTISKALFILENNKLIYTDRTNGKFVTSDLEIINKHRESIFEEKVDTFLEDLKLMGYTKEEIIKKIKEK